MAVIRRGSSHAHPSRQWPPLTVALVAALALLSALPSALNLPQSSPAETLEYAPVPPDDESGADPPSGNFSSLGLGSSSGLSSSDAAAIAAGEIGGRAVKAASTKRCVGSPPRQTEDPMSPPCVASFTGDNGGSVYQGVTADEVRVLFYFGQPTKYLLGSRGAQEPAEESGRIFDVAEPPEEDEPYHVEAVRIWQRYFNERFQTYGRFVHFYVQYSSSGWAASSPEQKAADAADGFARVKPFAVVVHQVSDSQYYIGPMARRGVLTFGAGSDLVSLDTYTSAPGLIWGYSQPLEPLVDAFTEMLCKQVMGRTVGDSGDPTFQGRPRKVALVRVESGQEVSRDIATDRIKNNIQRCGHRFDLELTYPFDGSVYSSPHDADAHTAMVAELKSNEITTVVWSLGQDKENSEAAKRAAYFPEWIVLGDGILEDISQAKWMDSEVWDHAWMFTNKPLMGAWSDTHCFKALKEGDPDLPFSDTSIPCRFYEDFRQLFTGIQVAGPRLTPETVDRGFHAIPAHPSATASMPACFYGVDDYSCVKDNALWQWDSSASSAYSSKPGCYRTTEGGNRYLPGQWPEREMTSVISGADPCNGFTTGDAVDPAPGTAGPPKQ